MSCPTKFSKHIQLIGANERGEERALKSGGGIIWGAHGERLAQWADGSDDAPITLPDLAKTETANTILVADENGRWMRLTPKQGAVLRQVLIQEAGTVYFEDIMARAMKFPLSILTNDVCDYKIAVIGACEGADEATMGVITFDQFVERLQTALAAAGAGTTVLELESMSGFIGGVPGQLAAGINKMIVSCGTTTENARWRVVERGLMFFPIAGSPPIFSVPAQAAQARNDVVSLSNFPTAICGAAGVYGLFLARITSLTNAPYMKLGINGVTMCTITGTTTSDTNCVPVLLPNGNPTVNIEFIGGSAGNYSAFIQQIGWYY